MRRRHRPRSKPTTKPCVKLESSLRFWLKTVVSDGTTIPLEVFVSDAVTQLLHAAGYPVAQNGVMIMVGAYQVLVKDACSGMNSIVALIAVGVFFAHEFHRHSLLRIALLLLAAIPIAIAANFVRVLALILIAYYQGVDALEGNLHGLAGFVLFAVALVLFLAFDATVGVAARLLHRGRPVRAFAQKEDGLET